MSEQFAIWGTGYRAEAIVKFFRKEDIAVFIDNDISSQGHMFYGKKIISFQEFLKNYRNKIIVVTPIYSIEEIILQIKNADIDEYLDLQNNPSELQGYGTRQYMEYVVRVAKRNRENVIIGDNLFTLLIYIKLQDLGYSCKICILDSFQESFRKILDKLGYKYCFEQDISENDYKIIAIPYGEYKNAVNAFDLSDIIGEYKHAKLARINNIYKGEKCFIAATGPSLKIEDLLEIRKQGIFTFSVNRIFEIDSEVWKPDCYVYTDRKGIEQYRNQIEKYDVPMKILTDVVESDQLFRNALFIHVIGANGYYVKPRFSEDIVKKVYGHATVIYAVIQIAIYMGFKEIFLIGADLNYSKGSVNNYFIESAIPDMKDHHTDQMLLAYLAAKEYADSHGIKIFNATRGGMLEVFERVDFDTLFHDR